MRTETEKNILKNDLSSRNWLGEVVNNEDEKHEFRCKIRVFGLFDDLEDDALPWAYPHNNNIFAGGEGGFGSGSVPKIGTILKVSFQNGDIYTPEYHSIQNINKTLRDEISDDYDGTHVLLYDEDEELKILYQKDTGIKIELKESHTTIKPDSSILIEHKDSKSFIELKGNDIRIESESNVDVKTKNCTVDSPNIKLGAKAVESVIKGNTFQTLFNTHTHIGNLGAPTTPPSIPLNGSELSNVTKTE